MTNTARLEFLKSEIETKKREFKKHSDAHKSMHRWFRAISFSLTALLSILAGWALYDPELTIKLDISILIISALASAIATYEGLRQPDVLWTHERGIFFEISDLERELNFESINGEISEEKLYRYLRRFQEILSNSCEKWSSQIVNQRNGNSESDRGGTENSAI